MLFGATVPRLALAHGLVDEILVHLALNLLGDGIRLLGSPGAGRTALEIGVWDEGRAPSKCCDGRCGWSDRMDVR